MSNLFTQNLGDILDAFSDAIEGGNSYRGSGTVYKGIPGLHSNDRHLRNGDDTPLTVVGSSVSATTFDVAGHSWPQSRWISTKTPPHFAVCTASGGATSILHERRKVTGWNNSTGVFTLAPALSASPVADDTFAMQEGFKRLPNDVEIDTSEDGYDRSFHLYVDPGEALDLFGDNSITYRGQLIVRLRLLKYARLHDWTAAAFTNLAILRGALPRREHYEANYTRALLPMQGATDVEVEDDKKIVVLDRYVLIYRVDGTAV